MIETRVIAYNERCDILYFEGIPFEIYWSGGVAFFAFYDEESMGAAFDLLGV